MKREGFILHLYAGGKEGFTLQRAFKQVGGDEGMMLEVDEKRGSGHDMLSDSQVYPSLLRAALEGKLKAILGGPNCRTRSVLRHFPVEGNPDAPRPVREWGGGEFGKAGLTPKEEAQVRDDDLLLWRMIYLYMVAHYMAQARGLPKVHFALEQPHLHTATCQKQSVSGTLRSGSRSKKNFNLRRPPLSRRASVDQPPNQPQSEDP